MQDLIDKAQEALIFLRENTEQGTVGLDIENHPGVTTLKVEISGDWFGVQLYKGQYANGRGIRCSDELSNRICDAIERNLASEIDDDHLPSPPSLAAHLG